MTKTKGGANFWTYCSTRDKYLRQNEYKHNKYADLSSNIGRKGFICHLYTVEVGARGLTAESPYALLKHLDLPCSKVNPHEIRISKAFSEVSYHT